MELAIKELKLDETTTVMDYNGEDPYQMIQVHDYQNVKFMRMNPAIRAASRKTIEVFSTAYPELLREKFFVNVPMIMGWMFTAMKMILSKKTTRKFHPITNGINLAREFPGLGEKFPAVYGGNGPDLVGNATSVLFDDSTAPAKNGDAANGVKEESAKEDPKIEPEVQVAAEAATEGAEAR